MYGFKMSALKELSYLEPVVDCIDPAQLLTAPMAIKTIDINTSVPAAHKHALVIAGGAAEGLVGLLGRQRWRWHTE